jgi:6-hydroxycyclohex-1-ene-1-carbonyl-CoA dehydrogenase
MSAMQLTPREIKATIEGIAKEQGLRQSERSVFERSGTCTGQEAAFSLLNDGATLTVVGSTMDKVEARLSNAMAFQTPVIGNCGCPSDLHPEALGLVMNGRVKVTPFAEKHPHSQIKQAFKAAHAAALKRRAVLVPEPSGAAP